MGCWNGTDFITQLPIMEDDEVVLIPIKKNRFIKDLTAENTCYQNTYFKPMPIILYGKYNDYGIISDVKGDIKQFIQIVEKESNLIKEEILKEESNEESLVENYIRFIERANIDNVGFVLLHKKLFDKLKDYDDYWAGKDNYIDEYYNAITLNNKIKYMKNNKVTVEELMDVYIDNSCSWSIFDRINLNEVNKESISGILSINSVLGVLRKLWIPQTGAGSQCQIEEPHRIINEFYNKYIENYDKEDL